MLSSAFASQNGRAPALATNTPLLPHLTTYSIGSQRCRSDTLQYDDFAKTQPKHERSSQPSAEVVAGEGRARVRQQVCALAEAVRQKRKLRKHSRLHLNTTARGISDWLERTVDDRGKCFRGIKINGKFYRSSYSDVRRVLQDSPPFEPARTSIICVRPQYG